jgi:hypothetical protein
MLHDERVLLRDFLHERDVRCPVCGYNLRGVASDHCPECGARLDLRVGSIDLKLGPWLLAVISVALPMGFTGVLTVIGLIGSKVSAQWRSRDWLIVAILAGITAALAGLLWHLIRRRAGFMRRPRASQWREAAAIAIVMALAQGAFVFTMAWYM